MWFMVIAVAAVMVYERYDFQILNFWRGLVHVMKSILPW
jgi:hypothetical protein